ncbi:reverse transcriptase domain-containing protein [Tanacetum coccineum]
MYYKDGARRVVVVFSRLSLTRTLLVMLVAPKEMILSDDIGGGGGGGVSFTAMIVDCTTVSVISPTGVLHLVDYSSSSDSDPSKDSIPVAPELPLVSPFLCTDDTQRKLRRLESFAERRLGFRQLMKLMAEVYCPRNEIQKMESELWNLTVKNNDLAAYTKRFQEHTMLYTKMVLNKEDRVEKFIGGPPDNIQGNVIAAKLTRLQDAVRIANNLMDQKLKGYAVKNVENKRKFDTARRTTVDSNHHSKDRMLEDRMWQEPTRLATMKGECLIDHYLSATSVNLIMKGHAL